MASKMMERKILNLENEYWQALRERDVDAALALTADPCLLVGASGVRRIDHRTYETMMRDESWRIDSFKIGDDVAVEMLSRNAAIIAYSVHEDMTVNGEPRSIDAAESSTWIRKDGKWVCVSHTESFLGEPYGRDDDRRQPQQDPQQY
jgi:hypothetical protein